MLNNSPGAILQKITRTLFIRDFLTSPERAISLEQQKGIFKRSHPNGPNLVVVLPDLFRGMGAWKNSTETQQSGHAPTSGPEVKNERIGSENSAPERLEYGAVWWWWCYPTPFEGWGRGGTPRKRNSRATPQQSGHCTNVSPLQRGGAVPLYPRGGPKCRDNYPEGPDHPVASIVQTSFNLLARIPFARLRHFLKSSLLGSHCDIIKVILRHIGKVLFQIINKINPTQATFF